MYNLYSKQLKNAVEIIVTTKELPSVNFGQYYNINDAVDEARRLCKYFNVFYPEKEKYIKIVNVLLK